jgi:hypothetical protein
MLIDELRDQGVRRPVKELGDQTRQRVPLRRLLLHPREVAMRASLFFASHELLGFEVPAGR